MKNIKLFLNFFRTLYFRRVVIIFLNWLVAAILVSPLFYIVFSLYSLMLTLDPPAVYFGIFFCSGLFFITYQYLRGV